MTATADLKAEYDRLHEHWRDTGEDQYAARQAYNNWFHQACVEGNPPDALNPNEGSESERFFARTIPGLDGHTYWSLKDGRHRLDGGGERNSRWWWYEHVNGPQERGSLASVCGEINCITPEHQQYVPWELVKRRYTDEQCLGALQAFALKIGHTPTSIEYKGAHAKPCREIISARFGGWPNALAAAGLEPPIYSWKVPATVDQCIAALRFAAGILGHAPGEDEFRSLSKKLQAAGLHSSPSTIYRCTGSWPKALKLAGLTQESRRNGEDMTPTKGTES
jgi:hypothetical protein